jgi:hypothetical protein
MKSAQGLFGIWLNKKRTSACNATPLDVKKCTSIMLLEASLYPLSIGAVYVFDVSPVYL